MSMKLPNNNVNTKMSQLSETTWKVNAVKSDGSAEMTQILDRMQIKVESPAGSFEVDSKKKAEGNEDGNRRSNFLAPCPFTVVIRSWKSSQSMRSGSTARLHIQSG